MKKVLFAITLFFMLMVNVFGEEIITELDCNPKTTTIDKIITCDIYITPVDFILNGYQTNYSFTNGTYVSFTSSSLFSIKNSGESENIGFVLTSLSNISSKTKVGVLKVRSGSIPNSTIVKLTKISASKTDYGSVIGDDVTNTIQVNISLTKPTIENISYEYNKVKLNIEENYLANKYKIYKSTSSSKGYKLIATTSNNAYEDTNVVVGKKYYYKVKSINDEGSTIYTSDYSSYKSISTRLSSPFLNVSRIGANYVSLSWNKISGAQGYRIYRSTSLNGIYSLVKTITSGSTLTYKNTSRVTNTTYYYKISAYRTISGSKKYSYYSNKIAAKPILDKPIIENISNNYYRYIRISITRTPYSHGYNVYRSTSIGGDFIYIGSTTSEIYYDKTAKEGTEYYYRIKAFRKYSGKKKFSVYSEKESGFRLKDTIRLTSVVETNKITINIDKLEDTNYYEVWKKTSKNDSYKLDQTLKLSDFEDNVIYEDDNLKRNKTYYYKIRAKNSNSGDYKYLTIKTK